MYCHFVAVRLPLNSIASEEKKKIEKLVRMLDVHRTILSAGKQHYLLFLNCDNVGAFVAVVAVVNWL